MPHKKTDLSHLAIKWPSAFVSREKLAEFSGGILHPRTMANRDSLGTGIKGRIRFGRKIAYPVDEVIRYLEEHVQAVD